MILVIGVMLLVVSIQVLLLSIDSKLDKIMRFLDIYKKSKDEIDLERYERELRRRFL